MQGVGSRSLNGDPPSGDEGVLEYLFQCGSFDGIGMEHTAHQVLGSFREAHPITGLIGSNHLVAPSYPRHGFEGFITGGAVQGMASEHDVQTNAQAPHI